MILVTGATGFVGSVLVSNLLVKSYQVKALVRQKSENIAIELEQVVGGLPDLVDDGSFKVADDLFFDVDVVIHCAGRAHIMHDDSADPLMEFRKVNRDATLVLAQLAAEAGVKRFIFISSIKVNGEMTQTGQPFKANDANIPTDPYGLSKYEAEQGLLAIAKKTKMEVVIIRPPLIYGPNVKANFASMLKWVYKGIPLPLGAIYNQRSLVALDNLVDFITHCIDHPQAANEIFLISDGQDVSTTELLQKVAKAFGKKSKLIPVPVWLMTFVAKFVGKGDVANRLFGSLQVDSSKARKLLGWKPVITMDEQLKKTADAYFNKSNV